MNTGLNLHTDDGFTAVETGGHLPNIGALADDICVGSAVFDGKGNLLLAASEKVTQRVKTILEHRLATQAAPVSAPGGKTVTMVASGNTQPLTALDSVTSVPKPAPPVSTGIFSVSQRGPAVRERVNSCGCQDYDFRRRKRLIDSHQRNTVALSKLIKRVLEGHLVNGDALTQMCETYVNELVADADSALTSRIRCLEDADSPSRYLHVALLAMAIGIEMGFDEDNVRKLGVCGIVCDWGMARVPEKIRLATRQLDARELIEIKKHPGYSLEMLEKVTGLPEVARIVAYQSHESPNGSGYPRGRSKTAIHPFARIVRVAETYLALTIRRPYRPPLMRHAAMECLVRQASEGVVDADVVSTMLRILSLFPLGSDVQLSNGTAARVLRRNGDDYTHPIVKCLEDRDGNPVDGSNGANIVNLAENGLLIEKVLPSHECEEIPLDAAVQYRI